MEIQNPPLSSSAPSQREAQMRAAAHDLEVTFLAEMLREAGLGETRNAFGGGEGEEQFSSLLVRAQAEQIVQVGGLSLAEIFFNSIMEVSHDK